MFGVGLQALKGAKQVHAFVRDSDDTIDWIQEKDVIVSTDDFGQDLPSVQALIAKHEGFEVSTSSTSPGGQPHLDCLISLWPGPAERTSSDSETRGLRG